LLVRMVFRRGTGRVLGGYNGVLAWYTVVLGIH